MLPRDATCRRLLLLVLLVSIGLRTHLATSGGQFFYPDERRYERSRAAASALVDGDFAGAVDHLARVPHTGFRIVGLVPALAEKVLGRDPAIAGLFFSIFSVLNIFLLWQVARVAGAAETEALLAAFLLAASSTFLYYSRHLLPYDVSFTFGLLAIRSAAGARSRLRSSFHCGLLAACCFFVYFGHWTLACFATLLPAFRPASTLANSARHLAVSCVGAATALLLFFGIDLLAGGRMIERALIFSNDPGLTLQGVFAEGWWLPIPYLWHAEHGLFALWLVALGASLGPGALQRLGRSASIGLLGVLFVYAALVVFSVGLHKFVVLGRLARQSVPFFCLLTATWGERVRTASGPRARWAFRSLVLLVLVQSVVNFHTPVTQVFPIDFARRAVQVARAHRAHTEGGAYRMVRVGSLYPEPRPISLPEHSVLLRAPHPTEYLPYQYEEFTPAQRAKLRSTDISMRLVYIPDAER